MKPAQFTNRDLAVAASRWLEPKFCNQEFGELMTHTIRGGTGNCAHERKCESYSIARSSNRRESVLSAAKSSRTTPMWQRTIKSRRVWEELGETTILTTSERHTGGATMKKDQSGWRGDAHSARIPKRPAEPTIDGKAILPYNEFGFRRQDDPSD